MMQNKKVKRGEKVTASFLIDKDGLMTKVKIVRFKDDETAMLVIETLNEMNNLKMKCNQQGIWMKQYQQNLSFLLDFNPSTRI